MPYNLSDAGEVARVGLGSGKLYIAPAGTTPTGTAYDVGYGRGGSLAITRQKVELLLGVPRRLISQFAIQEDVTLNFTGVEWDATNMSRTLGAGVLTGSGNDVTLEFGGDLAFTELAARFIHQMPYGGTLTFDLMKCQGSGEVTVNFSDEFHETPFALRALQALTGWDGATLNEKGGLFRVRIQIA